MLHNAPLDQNSRYAWLICFIAALFFFDSQHFSYGESASQMSVHQILSHVTLLTLWGFIGLESATTPAESVKDPSKVIPRAIVAGTICVAILYLINSLAIMGIIPSSELMTSNAPYADATRVIFGGSWHLIISIIASVICLGTLNAWTLTSGQISLGLAQDNLMPAFFGYKNKYDAPYWGLTISCLGIIPLLILTANESLAAQILTIIDFSVTAFLFIYAMCCCAFFKILLQKSKPLSELKSPLTYGFIALLFCCWVIYETPFNIICTASLFTLSGLPFYLYFLARKKRSRF